MKISKDFSGKVALITGGSRGIGKAIALEFARRGADIAFNYFRSHEQAGQTQKEIEAVGVQCLCIKAHLGETSKIKQMFSEIADKFGRLDILVNNAATGVQRRAVDLEEKHWDWTMSVNVKAPWICSVEAVKLMANGGHIINITSPGSGRVLPYYTSVGTSKASLESLTRYLAVELGPAGVSVNAVSGGYIETGALEHFPNRETMLAEGAKTPAGRMVQAEDMAKISAFLCTGDASMIRGQVIVVDGGVALRA